MRGPYDYVAIGHVTVDALLDGPGGPIEQPGGGAFYSALQAARLGLSALIVTRGVPRQVEALLAPYLGEQGSEAPGGGTQGGGTQDGGTQDGGTQGGGTQGGGTQDGGTQDGGGWLDLSVIAAKETTMFATTGTGLERRQRVKSWAGPIERLPDVECSIAHFAPVARETPRMLSNGAGFVGLTPQGLVRTWGRDGMIVQAALDRSLLPARLDAVVFSRAERESCSSLLDQAGPAKGALVAVTAGADPVELRLPGGEALSVETVAVESPQEDLGAGDVFAAALFIALEQGASPAEAARYGSAAAAVRMGGLGPGSVGDRSAIEAALARA